MRKKTNPNIPYSEFVIAGAARIAREKANELVDALLDVKERIASEHVGSELTFPEQLPERTYDLSTHKPLPEFRAAVERAVVAMREAGAPIGDDLSLD